MDILLTEDGKIVFGDICEDGRYRFGHILEDGTWVDALQQLVPTGVASAEVFGTGKLNLKLLPSEIVTAEVFGVASIVGVAWIDPDGIPSAEAIGTQQLLPGQVSIGVISIASLESFGTPWAGKALHPLGPFLPTGHNDPGTSWEDEADAYDGSGVTYAKEVIS